MLFDWNNTPPTTLPRQPAAEGNKTLSVLIVILIDLN